MGVKGGQKTLFRLWITKITKIVVSDSQIQRVVYNCVKTQVVTAKYTEKKKASTSPSTFLP